MSTSQISTVVPMAVLNVLTYRDDRAPSMTKSDDSLTRCNCFKLLAACFYEPDKQAFLEEGVHQNLQDLLSQVAPELTESASQLRYAFKQVSEAQLKVDYAALFIGPFALQAAPYGSVYLEKGGTVLGDSTMAVQHCYAQHGLALDVHEPGDHIAIELEFLSFLAAREAEAVASGEGDEAAELQQVQAQFLHTFMSWVPAFCSRIEKCAHTEYYRALAQCLASFYAYCSKSRLLTQPNTEYGKSSTPISGINR